MIGLSLFGWIATRVLVFAAVVALSVVAGVPSLGCTTCNDIGCLAGVSVYLDGDFEPGVSFDVALIEDGAAGSAPFLTCTVSVAASGANPTPQTSCSSSTVAHTELGSMILVRRDDVANLTVVVSSAGTELGRQSFQPAYTTTEPGGPGCGKCTAAAVHVTVP